MIAATVIGRHPTSARRRTIAAGGSGPSRARAEEVSELSVELHLPVSYDADVIVVGAGPAGAATAFHLARRGVDVLMLDAAEFPRDKVCGDFVGPVALRELFDMGVTVRPEFQRTNRVIGASLHLDGKRMVTRTLPEVDGLPRFGRVITRMELDDWIRQAAVASGARYRCGVKVDDVVAGDRSVHVEASCADGPTQLRARLVVGADGSNSKVARVLRDGAPVDKKDRIVAVRAYFSGVSGPGDRADMYFSESSFPGYYWLFPTSATTANVGLGMVRETTPPTDGHLRTMLLELIEQDPALRERLGGATMEGRVLGWPLSTYNHRTPLVRDGVMLVGDAAGLINPLNGEGIQYALLSGRWAADTIAAALRVGRADAEALRPYEQRVVAELRPEMALATTIVSLIRRRDLNPVWLQALRVICARAAHDKSYADLAGGILAGITPASSALSREIVGGTVKQAIRSAVGQGARGVLRPRAELRSLVDGITSTAGDVLGNTARDPVATASWAGDVASSLIELATQVAAGAGRSSPTVRGPDVEIVPLQSSRSTM